VTAVLVEKLYLEQHIKQTVETNKGNGEIRSGLTSALHNALVLRVRGRLVDDIYIRWQSLFWSSQIGTAESTLRRRWQAVSSEKPWFSFILSGVL